MGWWSSFKSFATRNTSSSSSTSTPTKTSTTTTTNLPPQKQDPIRNIDTSGGGVTIRGEQAWSGSSGGGGSSTPISVTSDLSPKQTEQVLASKGYKQAYLSPAGSSTTPTSPTVIKAAKEEVNKPRSYVPPPTKQDVAPTTWWGKNKLAFQTVYTASPFGMTTKIPDEYHDKRETGASRWFNTLSFKEAREGILDQRIKVATAKEQTEAINAFTTKLDAAPEDIKYDVYQAGTADLTFKGVVSTEKEGVTTFSSSALTPSRSQSYYDWEKSKGDTLAKTFLVARSGGAEAVKFYGGGLAIGGVAKGFGIAKVVAKYPKTVKGVQAGLLGLYGTGATVSYITTPKEYKGIRLAEIGGQVAGIGALIYGARSNAKYNKQIAAKNYEKSLQSKHLQNVKQLGLNSKYAKTGYQQVGTGKTLSSSVQKNIASKFGVSQSTVREASLFKQARMVKSSAGFKPYKYSKYGISFSQKTPTGFTEKAYKFKIYASKPVSIEKLTTIGSGKYAFSSRSIFVKGKFISAGSYLSKTTKVSSFDYGRGVKEASYLTETRLITKPYKATSFKGLWKTVGKTYGTGTTLSTTSTAPDYKNVRGGLRVAKEGSYIFGVKGVGQPTWATKNIYFGDITNAPKSTRIGATDYSAWAKTTSSGGGGSSGGVKTITKTITGGGAIQKIAPVYSINIATPVTRSYTSVAPVVGVATSGLFGASLFAGTSTITKTSNRFSSITTQIPTTLTATTVKQIPKIKTTATVIPITTPTFKYPTPTISTTTGTGRPSTIPTINSLNPFVFALPSFGFAAGTAGIGRVGAKAKYGYTPSYTALAFGITGKKTAPTIGKRYTGLEFRPITKEWANMFKSKGRKSISQKKTSKWFM